MPLAKEQRPLLWRNTGMNGTNGVINGVRDQTNVGGVYRGKGKRRLTCGAALLAVAEGGRADRPQPEALRSLLSRRVTRLVGMPQLLAVVTELCVAALPAAHELGTAGAAESNHCVPGGRQTRRYQE